MLKLVWMSDPHFTAEGEVLGHDPRVRLSAAVDHINTHHADASYCIISGDMVNRGTPTDYAALRGHLDALSIPMLPLVGNHDDRDLFRSALQLPDTCMPDFVQYSVLASGNLILCLDTQKRGSDAGEFCGARNAWLRNALDHAGETPVFLFMHHPPHALGLPMQDTDNMQDGPEFLDLVSAHDCVKHLFIGHVHRPISGTVRGLPFATMPSVLYQAPPPRPAWDWDTFRPSAEAPRLGILMIEDESVTLQYEEFCPCEHGGRTG